MWDRILSKLPAVMERAVKTFAQTLVAVIGVGATELADVDWWQALSAAVLAALLSVLTSAASWRLGGEPGPSAVGAEVNVESLPYLDDEDADV